MRRLIAARLGETPLKYDPIRKRNYERFLTLRSDASASAIPTVKVSLESPDGRDFMATARDLPALIIDIRGNGGGNDMY